MKGNAPELGEANVEKLTVAGLSLEEIEEATAQAATVREEAFAQLLGASASPDDGQETQED